MDQPNAVGIGVQTIQPDGTNNKVQPGQYEKKYEPAASTKSSNPKPEKQKGKSKKGCIIFIVLLLCCIVSLVVGLVAAYLNANTILKAVSTVKKDDTYATYTTATLSSFKLSDALAEETPVVDETGDMVITLTGTDISKHLLSSMSTGIQPNIGIKLEEGKILLQMQMSDLEPTIIPKDNFIGVYVNIVVSVASSGNTFKVDSITTGNGLIDSLLPADAKSKLETSLNAGFGELDDGLTSLAIKPNAMEFTYLVQKFSVSNATTHPSGYVEDFDVRSLRSSMVDSDTVDLFYTPLQWIKYWYSAKNLTIAEEGDLYVDLTGDVMTYYVSIDWLSEDYVKATFDAPTEYFCKVTMKVKAMKEMVVDTATCGNTLLDKYYIVDLTETSGALFDTGVYDTITEWDVENNEVRVRVISGY